MQIEKLLFKFSCNFRFVFLFPNARDPDKNICFTSTRVSSKQTKKIFGSNRNKPKLSLFRLFFGLFRETNTLFFRLVSVFRIHIETTETNRSVSKQAEKKLKKLWEKQ
jgi:hypothetical protein